MKQLVLSFMLAMFAFLFPNSVFAQVIPDDDGEEITITIDESTMGNGLGRSLYSAPFRVTLFHTLSCVEVEFPCNIGDVSITLTNLTTGGFSTTIVDSQFSSTYIPLMALSVLWKITIIIENGVTYNGYFFY